MTALAQSLDDDTEVAAVLKVIAAESEAFFNKDFEAFSRSWMQESYIRRLGWWTRGGVSDVIGWEDLSASTRRLLQRHPEPNRSAQELRRENLVVRVSGDMAWATFDQHGPDTGEPDMDMPGVSREARVLERRDGEWRIVYHTFIHRTSEPARAPMFRLDKEANVSWMNKAGEAALGDKKTLAMIRGKLRAISDTDNKRLRAAIQAASERDGMLDGARPAIPIILDPGETDDVCICWVLTEGSGGGAVIVSINDLTFAQDQLDVAATVFGLSESQRRLAELILSGRDLVLSAAGLGVSVNTARTHLQRIFEKTGVRSQVSLVRALLSVSRPT